MMLSSPSLAAKLAAIVAVGYLVAFFALSSGLINSILEGRTAQGFIIPSRSVQTIGETIVATLILFMGMAGAFLLYRAGKSTTSPKAQQATLAAGFAAIAIAMIIGFTLVNVKI